MQTHRSFLEDIVDESVELRPMSAGEFDAWLARGWRLLGYSFIRHNIALCRGRICKTIPLRLRLDEHFTFSGSQKKLLRRNRDLNVRCAPIAIDPEKENMFSLHTERFRERQPLSVFSFLNPQAHNTPVTGLEYSVYDGARLVACSYFHLGEKSMSGTYCFFDPAYARRSLGAYTMLLEIQRARQMGKEYYYHGYCYDVPSQFDYKMNFENLESMDWKTETWAPLARVPLRRWESIST